MSSSRLGFLSSFVLVALVALSTACSESTDSELGDGEGTGPNDGKFVPPPTKPEDGQKSSTTGGSTSGNTAKDAPAPPPATPAPTGAVGSCAAPQCQGIAGVCGCRGGSEGKQTIMACFGGKCRCNDKTLDDDGACTAAPNLDKLKVLFASCGCQ